MRENMKNIAYTKEYQEYLEDIYKHLFNTECFKSEENCELNSEISIHTKEYFCDSDNSNYPYNLDGTENVIYQNGKEIYTFRTVNNNGYYWKFQHQNGQKYIVFAKDLYGYSVLNLDTMQDYHFYPAESFPTGETFIWTNIHYNHINNILAVEGCYWACPSSVVLVDFSDPLKDNLQVNIHDFIDENHEKYDDIDFASWDGTDLVLKMDRQITSFQEECIIKQETYMDYFVEEKF